MRRVESLVLHRGDDACCPSASFCCIFTFLQTQEDVTKEVPLWTPPFPPEEFDDYDEGFVSEGQVSAALLQQHLLQL